MTDMKKLRSNGGYALVYVVVAMTLMLAIVGGVTVTASRNLRTQQSAVSMMEERYKAAGEVEAIFAKIVKPEPYKSEENTFKPDVMLEDIFTGLGLTSITTRDDNSFTAKIEKNIGNTTVTADILVRYTVTREDAGDGKNKYTVTVTSVSYEDYKVEYKEST